MCGLGFRVEGLEVLIYFWRYWCKFPQHQGLGSMSEISGAQSTLKDCVGHIWSAKAASGSRNLLGHRDRLGGGWQRARQTDANAGTRHSSAGGLALLKPSFAHHSIRAKKSGVQTCFCLHRPLLQGCNPTSLHRRHTGFAMRAQRVNSSACNRSQGTQKHGAITNWRP